MAIWVPHMGWGTSCTQLRFLVAELCVPSMQWPQGVRPEAEDLAAPGHVVGHLLCSLHCISP